MTPKEVQTIRTNTIIKINTQLSRMVASGQIVSSDQLGHAIQGPIREAFRGLSEEDSRKLYRCISLITHPDKIQQNGNNDKTIEQFKTDMMTLSKRLVVVEDQSQFLNSAQQEVEHCYKKDLLPTIASMATMNLSDYMRELERRMTRLYRDHEKVYLRYALPIQYLIDALQYIVNAVLILSGTLLFLITYHLIYQVILPKIILSFLPKAFVFPSELYTNLRRDHRTSEYPLQVFIGSNHIKTALNSLVTQKELADYYRTYFIDSINFSDESDETVLCYAAEQLYPPHANQPIDEMIFNTWDRKEGLSQTDYIRLLNKYRETFFGFKYARLLTLAFYKAMETPEPLPVEFVYKEKQGRTPPHMKPMHWDGKYWLDPFITRRNPAGPQQLPDSYIQTEDDLFYYNDEKETLNRLEPSEKKHSDGAMHTQKPDLYICYGEHLFFYNRRSEKIHRINTDDSTFHATFSQKPTNGPLSDDDLNMIKALPGHDALEQSMFMMEVGLNALKLFRAVFFVPFLFIESLTTILSIMFKASLTLCCYAMLAIKLGITLLLNSPLYLYDAWNDTQPAAEATTPCVF
ncbi:MAG TPA: hypothetical protein DDY37_01500 [Legionella sp.]|nr:hypothetical protein [Legionella sp.]